MPTRTGSNSFRLRVIFWAAVAVLLTALPNRAAAQIDNHNFNLGGGLNFNNVGGVAIDAEGTVADIQRKAQEDVRAQRDKLRADIPEGMGEGLELRKVSLRELRDAITKVRLAEGRRTVPEHIRYLCGLQRIQYVFVYPEDNDIVLAGPGEPWRFDDFGNPVGKTTGQPVVELEFLLAALRIALHDPQVISCSIDPTPEGIQRMRTYVQSLSGRGATRDPSVIRVKIEQLMGPQTITISGIDPTSRYAGILVAADYRMKRLAMGFEPAPVPGMPSFLEMVGTRRVKNMMPRWWLEDDYEALLTDGEGLAWKLQGQGVKAMSEDELVADDGSRKSTGKADPIAKKWADSMTSNYKELATKLPVFGQLRNCMDVAVISALIASERLHEKAGLELGYLIDPEFLPLNTINPPQHIASQVSHRKSRSHLIMTVSGGVQIKSWQVAKRREKTDALAEPRDDAIAPAGASWWWD